MTRENGSACNGINHSRGKSPPAILYRRDSMPKESLDEIVDNQDEQPVVSYFVHEADMMHKDADNERLSNAHKSVTRTICMTFIVLILIFVIGYTVRTAMWQNTVLELKDAIVQSNERVVELARLYRESVEVDHAKEADTP